MKCPCLFLALFSTLVTCEAQRSNNDIIWYPVEEEEGVFISIYGEKRRDAPFSRWRSHRRARYSGTEQNLAQALPLSYDPTENQDFSFFHDVNERRPGFSATEFEGNRKKEPHKKGPGNENNLQEILNEVFDYNRYPPTSSQKPWNPTNVWGGSSGQRPTTGGQWNGRPQTGNQWGQRPVTNTGRPQTVDRPNAWLTTENGNNRPVRPGGSDALVFPDDSTRNTRGTSAFTTTTTPSNLVPTDRPTMSPCERSCPVTPEFNPVCGSDAMTYTNAGRLKCAQLCGKDVRLSHHGNCGRTTLVTPLVSNNRVRKLKGIWF